ncbi:FAD-binding domain-containing protein [Annulohypoxylon maeteangense]|uniref:FAD-binding domain-containing protein n=1 Tax=Annulohypoxylon maeteangense TaxID=1927788 RepID=UPI00200754D2|nr:FAD-binding domain-containing protein [Annulohypoxylon maeteangense]KAI0886933.1 FAD-binding domain-containing protein [Annulohypoxylon maeteangense]
MVGGVKPLIVVLIRVAVVGANSLAQCKYLPSDVNWPSQDEWAALNNTVGGRLIATIPLGSPCHDPTYDEKLCASLQDQWLYSGIHLESSSSVMAPIFANQSCDPWQPQSKPCTLGNYVSYSVNVSKPDDVIAALNFSNKKNVRFVIRNTGHDYLGRSTGAGALSVWLHHLKSTEVLDWIDPYYNGKALKIGAGVLGYEALAAADASGLVVLTGECPTVGIAGGYTQGGGHSALSSNFGLAADNTLSFEVVTPTGELLTASRTENQDLYWALSGGGGGNYGVVISMTVQAHPDNMVSGASFQINGSDEDPNQIFDAIDAFHAALPEIVDSGVMIIYFFTNTFLQIPAMTAYNKSLEEVEQILEPLTKSLSAIGVSLKPNFTEFPSYYDHYNNYWGPLPQGNIQVGTQLFGGRLIPRSVLPDFSSTVRKIAEMGVVYIGVGLNVSQFGQGKANAVLPQWRESIVHAALTLPWSFQVPFEENVETQLNMTNKVQPVVEAATPGAGAYMNEADFQQSNWQETFFGANYPELRRIKAKYDPDSLLYATVGVGSEAYTVSKDGRMCSAVKASPESVAEI